ncbi:unnamed protein product [Phytophthora lilii]|uniref:Unnamed protein product n=1 Tax=Phytophthora lilii TaxID=2077276 RepID=A0A9W6TFQ2_9STRA|nr:unnamed protein product [Phytophthora lilii]
MIPISHLEGKQGSKNIELLPEDLFRNMPWLFTVHIGVHWHLVNFPKLSGVSNLQSLTLAWLLSLRELPPFDDVPRLHRLILTLMPHFNRVPDMAALQALSEFRILRPVQLWSNGFLGMCDRSDSYCKENPASAIPAAKCLNEEPFLGKVGTRDIFHRFSPTICHKLPSDLLVDPGIPSKQTIAICNNKPFGQCHLSSGQEGICYNTRMQVLSCYGGENYINFGNIRYRKALGKCAIRLLRNG